MEGIEQGDIYIESEVDGAYLVLDSCIITDQRKAQREIFALIKKSEVREWNPELVAETILEALSTESARKKISDDPKINVIKEDVVITVTDDKMYAILKYIKPVNHSLHLSALDVMEKIKASGVIFGIDEIAIDLVVEEKLENKNYVVAKGYLPKHSIEGNVEYFVEVRELAEEMEPQISDLEEEDFRNLSTFNIIEKNTKIAKITYPIEGCIGKNVFGEILNYEKCDDFKNVETENIYYNDDKTEIYASLRGQLVMKKNILAVKEVMIIDGDVDEKTGNIDSTSPVIIKGNIMKGFSVKSIGDIEVGGVVEGATINCVGSLIVFRGIQGMGVANISVTEQISAKFIENANVYADGHISAGAILNSTVIAAGFVEISGRNGMLAGGELTSHSQILLKKAGSAMAVNTKITLGVKKEVFDRYKKLKVESKLKSAEIMDNEKKINILNSKNSLSIENDKMLIDCKSKGNKLVIEFDRINEEIDKLTLEINDRKRKFSIKDTIYQGCTVSMNETSMNIEEEIESCEFAYRNGKIEVTRI